MKKFLAVITTGLGLILSASLSVAQTAPAQAANANLTLPTELSGKWYTPDREFSYDWGLKEINSATHTAKMFWNSTNDGCSMKDVPVKFRYDGTTLTIDMTYPNGVTSYPYCFTTPTFNAVLRKEGTEFKGTVSPHISPKYPTLDTVLK